MSFIKEFKEFAVRGNVMDMAVGVVIGGAFGKIVSSLVGDVIMPIIGVLTSGVDFKSLKFTIKEASENIPAVTINYGMFIQTIIDFTIIAFCIFLAIKAINRLKQNKPKEDDAPKELSDETKLLSEIRDLLKK
ncbi:MAG: large-conductance mechanosensitive channel protein MscL [Campylobacter sp.]